MTEDEKRRQKADLLLEYREAEENLLHLRQRAHQMARPFASVAAWLKHIGTIDKKPDYGDVPTLTESIRGQLDLDAVIALTKEIKLAENLFDELQRRKTAFNL